MRTVARMRQPMAREMMWRGYNGWVRWRRFVSGFDECDVGPAM